MGIVKEKIKDLKAREARMLEMGGEKLVAKHKEKGRLTARERLGKLFDKGTFREIDMFVRHRCVNFGMADVEIPSDGVVTGHGLVDGRPVFAFAQDFTSRAGSLGEMQAKKICKVMDMALKGRGALRGPQRFGRCPHPGGCGFALRLRPDLLPQLGGLRRDPPDLGHHGPHGRRGGLFTGHDRLYLHGQEHQLHVHHRPRSDQIGHRRGDQLRGPGRRHGPQRKKRCGPVCLRERRGRPRPDQAAAVLSAGQQHGRAAGGGYRRRPHAHGRSTQQHHPGQPQQILRHARCDPLHRGQRRNSSNPTSTLPPIS